jgi:hypothetical protein
MARFKCRTPGVRGLYVRIAKLALLSTTTVGGAKPLMADEEVDVKVSNGSEGSCGSTAVA